MATWTEFRYGSESWRKAQYWVPDDDVNPATNPLRPCLVYCPGHGWEGRHPNFFYSSPVGTSEPLFTDHIEPAEQTTPVVCISIWGASANHGLFDDITPSAWTTQAYVAGDVVSHGGSYWRCVRDHTSTASHEPGVGAFAGFYWIELLANDATNNLLGADMAPGTTPAFLGTGIRDVQQLVQHLKREAGFFGLDPTKIRLMGSSAGGQQAGAAAYGYSAPFQPQSRESVAGAYRARASSAVEAVILDITPNDWRWYPWSSAMENLFGRSYTADEWDRESDALKAALSPLGALTERLVSIPTYLAYAGSRFDHTGGTDDPPYNDALFHDARNGWEILRVLEQLGEPNVVFLEDSLTAGFFERWTSTTVSTEIPDTDRALDIWTWFQALG